LFHIGVVVPNLEDAQRRMTDVLGLSWGPTVEASPRFRDHDGRDVGFDLRFANSTEAPHLELIEEVPGSPWVCNEHSNIHHIGYFCDRAEAEVDRLVDAGCPFEIGSWDGEGTPLRGVYHRDEHAVRLEFVNESMRPVFAKLFQPTTSSTT
jgi:catechol 2,3-dioxygenase-like lactoylglutathione lyase family enzyme